MNFTTNIHVKCMKTSRGVSFSHTNSPMEDKGNPGGNPGKRNEENDDQETEPVKRSRPLFSAPSTVNECIDSENVVARTFPQDGGRKTRICARSFIERLQGGKQQSVADHLYQIVRNVSCELEKKQFNTTQPAGSRKHMKDSWCKHLRLREFLHSVIHHKGEGERKQHLTKMLPSTC
ncbi:hypothetical protein C0J52_02735 [Blattella germanica]|nr:hypothetical protein C0J52_02735 [Blattella germanica]